MRAARELRPGDWISWKNHSDSPRAGLVLCVKQLNNHPGTDVWYYLVTVLQGVVVSEEIVWNPRVIRQAS